MPPPDVPLGLQLTAASRAVSRAFDEALSAAGGSLPMWLILLNLKARPPANQRELAEAVGVKEATLTHHLNAMNANGLITRNRHASNRRIHIVELTAAGEELFVALRTAAIAFDRRLRNGVSAADATALEGLLSRLSHNVGAGPVTPPWAGLVRGPHR